MSAPTGRVNPTSAKNTLDDQRIDLDGEIQRVAWILRIAGFASGRTRCEVLPCERESTFPEGCRSQLLLAGLLRNQSQANRYIASSRSKCMTGRGRHENTS